MDRRKINHKKVLQLYKEGMSKKGIARQMRCVPITVRRIIAEHEPLRSETRAPALPQFLWEGVAVVIPPQLKGIITEVIKKLELIKQKGGKKP